MALDDSDDDFGDFDDAHFLQAAAEIESRHHAGQRSTAPGSAAAAAVAASSSHFIESPRAAKRRRIDDASPRIVGTTTTAAPPPQAQRRIPQGLQSQKGILRRDNGGHEHALPPGNNGSTSSAPDRSILQGGPPGGPAPAGRNIVGTAAASRGFATAGAGPTAATAARTGPHQRPVQAVGVNNAVDAGRAGNRATGAAASQFACEPARHQVVQRKPPAPGRPRQIVNGSLNSHGLVRNGQGASVQDSSSRRVSHPAASGNTAAGRNNTAAKNSTSTIDIAHDDEDDAFGPPVRSVRDGTTSNDLAPSYDVAQELQNIPSDAFASSSPAPRASGDDAILISSQASPGRRIRPVAPPNTTGLRQTTLFGRSAASNDSPSQSAVVAKNIRRRSNMLAEKPEPPTHHKLDHEAVKTWVYPTNLGAIRDYQYNIVARGLFHNLLVALPTGLGKTFIAATIMLNFFRWTRDAQIVFVAPTKPLVSQQVEACFGIAGIPRSATTMLTGGVSPGLRKLEWEAKRVFFMTPQTVMNDLKQGICDPKRIVLLVVDEAHRATGAYAYVEMVKFVRRFNECFRVLALTATPGGDVEAVQKVIDGLDIARVEIRTENSLDIRQYVHQRRVEKVVFENSDEMVLLMDLFSRAVQPVLSQLNAMNAYWVKDPVQLTPYGLTMAKQQWFASAGRTAAWPVKQKVSSIAAILASLAHSMDLLKYHGITPFYHGLLSFRASVDEGGSKSKHRLDINNSEHFRKMISHCKAWVANPDFVGHPKLEYVREVVMNHLLDAGEGRDRQTGASNNGGNAGPTRIMIFAHWRDSAEEIVRVLSRSAPLVRPHVFVGQAAAKNSEGMDQKRQLEVISKFKGGEYNVLVATSIGEEGLDIGEVDLIVCYDSKASPIRMLQRMGRTGRKRAGKILLLQMSGKEEDDALKAKDGYEKMQELIACGDRFQFHDARSRRIVPREVQPAVDKRRVEIPFENSQEAGGDSWLPVPKARGRAPKRPPKKFHMPDGVRTGFVSASRMEGDGKEDALAVPEEEPVDIPPLEDVLLSPAQRAELEAQIMTAGHEDVVPQVRLDAHVGPFSHMKPALLVRPGRVRTAFVAAARGCARLREDCVDRLERGLWDEDRELHEAAPSQVVDDKVVEAGSVDEVGEDKKEDEDDDDDDDDLPSISALLTPRPPRGARSARNARGTGSTRSAASARARGRARGRGSHRPPTTSRRRAASFVSSGEADEAPPSSTPPASDPRLRLASQGEWLGSQDTEGEYTAAEPSSELRAFVVDDDEDVGEGCEPSSSLVGGLDLGGGGGLQRTPLAERRFWRLVDVQGGERID
ncbi:hypothetical protein BDY21DRAFT_424954 [Lineolata rhizophorae]|uniref:ATP-dependent DNA helicase n=1 Tax=Lineolata rhizophorae TaxID=578093 RepID=A0A6A6NLR8_9PEZI|nr:hypothetical protein BDY21DRAFT_424954 [Lineolata rhizophorae]